ncbi:LysR family transcriptional regulator [Leuconostoc litchii]|uniref:LysR family transcriptional regulator n=1 Tax=Leuconostoc litchii TaxID=1981069 RepID=UPI001AD6633B|nr:LysR family transcriptional regulator [Leuconostoc litchii]GMA69990.1 LysR family transcriptional regulator [Leuconostoc litchii]
MSTFSYQVFATVVRYQSFYQASQVLNVTPSAVSHSINQLEEQLGFPLLIRSRSGMTLTHDGEIVLPFVQKILDAEADLQQMGYNINGLRSGSIKIGAFSSVCINWLPKILSSFSKKYPDIEVSIVQGSFEDISKKVKSGELDIGFTTLPVADSLDITLLIKDPIYCITPADFEPENKKNITPQDIINQKFILQKIDYDRDTKSVLDNYSVTINSINFSIDDQSIISMVEAGIGFGILPELALQKIQGNVKVYPFHQSFVRQIVLVMNKSKIISPSVAELVVAIRDFVTQTYAINVEKINDIS